MNLKKIAFGLLVGTGLVLGGANVAMAQQINTANTKSTEWFGLTSVNNSDIKGVAGAWLDKGDGLISVIKGFLNWVLGLLALIAFALLLYGGFTMVTAGGDEAGYKKWFTVLKNAAMWLAFIALSWMIVSLIFYVLKLVSGAGGAGG